MRYLMTPAALLLFVLGFIGCGDSSEETTPTPSTSDGHGLEIDPEDFMNVLDNPLFPMSEYSTLVYEGDETDPETGEAVETRVEMTVLTDEKMVAGVRVLVIRDEAFEDGELVESTQDYFAQHVNGSVYYFGEEVNNYEDGEVKDHDGSWLAGEGENLPGIIMPPAPAIGDVFEQEKAPGIAEDQMTVLSLNEAVEVPAGSFTGCLKTEDVNPLDANGHVEYKYYCPGVGFVMEEFAEGSLELISYE